MPVRDVLHWTPDPIGEAKRNLEQITVDSEELGSEELRGWARMKMQAAADVNDDGTFTAWYVTDDRFEVEHVLSKRQKLWEGRYLGSICPGLYLTTYTGSRERHSRKRWAFLKDLDQEGVAKLHQAIRSELLRETTERYITEWEYTRAMDSLDRWLENKEHDYGVLHVGDQPYNIDVPKIAKDIGVAEPGKPDVIQVYFEGRYLDLTEKDANEEAAFLTGAVLGKEPGAVTRDEVCDVLRAEGWDGAFTRTGFSTSAEIVIWNGDKIMRYGGWRRG